MTTPWDLQQDYPGRGAYQQGCPERHQHEQQQQIGSARRRLCDEVGDGIAQHQAQRSDAEADDERAGQKGDVDAQLNRLWNDFALQVAVEIERVQVVPRRESLAGPANREPCGDLVPGVVDADHQVAAGCPLFRCGQTGLEAGVAGGFRQPVQAAGASRDDAAQPSLDPVDTGCHPSQCARLPRSQELVNGSLEYGFARRPASVPVGQRKDRFGDRVRDHGFLDAARQHRPEGSDKGHADEGEQRQHEHPGAQPGVVSADARHFRCAGPGADGESRLSSLETRFQFGEVVGEILAGGGLAKVEHLVFDTQVETEYAAPNRSRAIFQQRWERAIEAIP